MGAKYRRTLKVSLGYFEFLFVTPGYILPYLPLIAL